MNNLTAISGLAGSGKDEIGKIIQYLTSDLYKNDNLTYKQYLNRFGEHPNRFSNWQIKKFAGKLKQISSLILGVTIEKWESQEFKASYMPKEWNMWRVIADKDGWLYNKYTYFTDKDSAQTYSLELANTHITNSIVEEVPITYRQFLLFVGTDALRDKVNENIWVNALFSDYKSDPKHCFSGGCLECTDFGQTCKAYPNWIITDLRFLNEFKAIKERGGICIRVNRKSLLEGSKTGNKHISETELNNVKDWDFTIDNDGSIEDLIEKVKQICQHPKLNII